MKILMKSLKKKIRTDAANQLHGQLKTVCAVILSFTLLGFSVAALAHQQKTAVTRILFNPNTDKIEVMHRFFVHDAEHAAGVVFAESQNLLESAESRELFSSYVINRFAIEAVDSVGMSKELELSYVGAEVDGQYIWVYQEIFDPHNLVALNVINIALRDVWPDQSNLVNVEKDGSIQSMQFQNEADILTVDL